MGLIADSTDEAFEQAKSEAKRLKEETKKNEY